jgi:hypothetical protein
MSVAPTALVPSYAPARNVTAGTPAPVERAPPAQPSRRGTLGVALGVVVLAVGSGVGFVMMQKADRADPADEMSATMEPSSAAAAKRPEPPAPPTFAMAPSDPTVAPSPSTAAARSPPGARVEKASPPAPVAKSAEQAIAAAPGAKRPATAPSSRTTTHGLVESNPFR